MVYHLNLPGNRILGANSEYVEARFYPFQRAFFTLLEQRIDTAVLNKFYKDAAGGVAMPEMDPEDAPDIVEIDTNDESNDSFSDTIVVEISYTEELSDTIQEEEKGVVSSLEEEEEEDGEEEEEEDEENDNYKCVKTPLTFNIQNSNANGEGPWGDSIMPWTSEARPPNGRQVSFDSGYAEYTDSYLSDAEPCSLQLISAPGFPDSLPSYAASPDRIQVGGVAIQDVQNAQLVITAAGKTPPTSACFAESQSLPFNTIPLDFGLDTALDVLPSASAEYVVKGGFCLFGLIPAELHTLQTSSTSGTHQRVTLPGNLSLGNLLPTLAGSPLDAITLTDTTLTYRSQPTPTLPAGLTLATTIHLSGFLDPINTVLRDVFGQDRPRIDFSGLISSQPDCLKRPPTPSGFTLRGELPEVSITLFGVLELTHLSVSIMARRISSAGGYDYAYGFDGRGRIADLDLDLSMRKHHDHYRMILAMTGEIWKNVGGIVGINVSWFLCRSRPKQTDTAKLENVQFEAAWQGTSIASVQLELKATFKLRSSYMLLRGLYSQSL